MHALQRCIATEAPDAHSGHIHRKAPPALRRDCLHWRLLARLPRQLLDHLPLPLEHLITSLQCLAASGLQVLTPQCARAALAPNKH